LNYILAIMSKSIINTSKAPAPIGPYSQAVFAGNTLYISGQICLDPANGALKNQNVREEAIQVMENLKAILAEAGLDFSHVVKTTIFLTDMKQFGEVNEEYAKYFQGSFPARETVQVSALPKFVNVEISMIAGK
jgi:2-iminobutanoate/2-iminopropanoate deaminase